MTDEGTDRASKRAPIGGRSRSGRPAPRPTIFDVARVAGVSYSTVSRVVNGLPNISQATRERVEAAMGELGYTTHLPARALATGRSNQIGLLVQQLEDPFFLGVIAGADRAVMDHGFDLLLCTTHDRREKETAYVARLTRGMVDGLLVLMPRSLPDWLDQLVTAHTPFVIIDHDGEAPGADLVNAANEDGARLATEHLIGLRHRRIAHITGAAQTGSSHSRVAGYRAALKAARMPVREELIVEGDYEEARGYEAALQLLSLPARRCPTAIVASNDRTAMGVYQAAGERGIRIPDELSVVGFDDEPAAARMTPPLTTIRQPTREMGRVGVERLIERMKHPDVAPKRIVLPVELVVRGSTAPRPV